MSTGMVSQPATTATKFFPLEYSSITPSNINVVLRVRPLNEAEKTKPGELCVKVSENEK